MVHRNKNILKILTETEKQFGKYYYVRRDLHLDRQVKLDNASLPQSLLGKKIIEVKDYDGVKMICEDSSWLMFRGSGTEPIMRIYAEAKNLIQAKKLLDLGEKHILSR